MRNIRYVVNAKKLKEDPLGYIIDTIVALIINLVIPVPLVGDLVIQFRGIVLWFLGTLVALMLFLVVTVGIVVLTPTVLTSGFIEQLLSNVIPRASIPDVGFTQTNIPSRSPLGGSGLAHTTITAGFMDPGYLIKFGKNHTGVDFVPSSNYFKDNSVYKETKKIVIFSTHTGKTRTYTDQYGGKTVEIMNKQGNLKTIYVHFKEIYLDSGVTIDTGTPLGEMGKTGKATGEHVHYEVQIKDGNSWRSINPLTYIK